MSPTDLKHSIRQIRRRLFLILAQAFGLVVVLVSVFILGFTGIVYNSGLEGMANSFVLRQPLQSYYLGEGSWQGIERLFANLPPELKSDNDRMWNNALLLDQAGRVVIDRGQVDTPLVGQVYTLTENDGRVPVMADGVVVGTIVNQRYGSFPIVRISASILIIVIIVSVIAGALTLVIGIFLVRRIVTPLADVIGAAQAVTAGDLSARVTEGPRGPGDLRSLVDSFNRMASALERNDRERREFLADIAHELRTPLTVIRGRLEGIVDGVYPPDEDHVAPVLEETYVLERLVEDLRLLSLAESRQLHFDKQSIQLEDLAKRSVELFQPEAEEKNINLSLTVESDTPSVTADPQRVGQVIGNLLSNALRYVPAGGKVVVSVSRAAEAGRVRLSVRDNGPGVAPEAVNKLFDRFWRGEKSRARSEGGAGLGLAIARQLMEAQGGTIMASNVLGGGLEVVIVL
jgi:two-component system OmpR family sensor kinase/two-component system sensor histidine kinase BaeS